MPAPPSLALAVPAPPSLALAVPAPPSLAPAVPALPSLLLLALLQTADKKLNDHASVPSWLAWRRTTSTQAWWRTRASHHGGASDSLMSLPKRYKFPQIKRHKSVILIPDSGPRQGGRAAYSFLGYDFKGKGCRITLRSMRHHLRLEQDFVARAKDNPDDLACKVDHARVAVSGRSAAIIE